MKQEYRNTTETIPINVTQYIVPHIKFDFMKLENSGHWSEMVLNIISLLF